MGYLKSLWLNGTAVEELPESIDHLFGLRRIELKNCNGLLSLPGSICKLKYLGQLDLTGISKFKNFPEILEPMENLRYLCLNGTAVEELDESIERLFGLQRIELKNCNRLLSLPASIFKLKYLWQLDLTGCSKFEYFPEILEPMGNLKYLCLNGTAVKKLPESIERLFGLQRIELKNCNRLLSLPASIYKLKDLGQLDLTGCSKFKDFPEVLEPMENLDSIFWLNERAGGELPKKIKHRCGFRIGVELKNCKSLLTLPSSICKLKSLVKLDLTGSSKFEDFPEILEPMGNLKYLRLNGTAVKGLPKSIENLVGLLRIELKNCNMLMSLPTSICKLKYLEELDLTGSFKFEDFPEILEPMENLKYLWLHGTVEKFLESIERLFALRRIELKNCNRLMSPPTNICKRRREEFDASGSEMFSSYEEQENDVLPQTIKGRTQCTRLPLYAGSGRGETVKLQ